MTTVLMFYKLLLCFLLFGLAISSVHSFQEQQAFQHDQESVLRRFSVNSDHDMKRVLDIAQENNLDVWHATSSGVDIYFPTNSSAPIFDMPFTEWSISFPPPAPQIQTLWNLSSLSNSSYHDAYHPLTEIEEFMFELSMAFPELIEIVTLGRSAELRDMLAMKISKSASDRSKTKSPFRSASRRKRSIVIMGAQHAREWISVSTALYLAHGLVADSSEPYSLAALLDRYDFYIIPVANPDGYVYTWESDRLWYKNRQVLGPNAKCVGVDMGRNWGYKWRHSFDPIDSCSYWYPGSRPFQSPEVNNIANYVATLPNVNALLEFRSYGQMISSPFSFSCEWIPRDAEDQLEAALGAASVVAKVHGTPYRVGNLCSTLYQAPGNAIDWMYKRAGIKYSYAVHLRDTGTYGFSLPAEWIKPVGEETVKMVEYIANFMGTVAA